MSYTRKSFPAAAAAAAATAAAVAVATALGSGVTLSPVEDGDHTLLFRANWNWLLLKFMEFVSSRLVSLWVTSHHVASIRIASRRCAMKTQKRASIHGAASIVSIPESLK